MLFFTKCSFSAHIQRTIRVIRDKQTMFSMILEITDLPIVMETLIVILSGRTEYMFALNFQMIGTWSRSALLQTDSINFCRISVILLFEIC